MTHFSPCWPRLRPPRRRTSIRSSCSSSADIVVQLVMAGLLLASIWVWTIIVSFAVRMAGVAQGAARPMSAISGRPAISTRFRRSAVQAIFPRRGSSAAGIAEWRRSTGGKVIDREGARQRLAGAMDAQVHQEADKLAERLNFLATVGAVAPFVGLFGTVWGIMNSFFQIGQQQNTSLAVVAPGISEALFATAIGLFAAIPAVIAYNRFSHRVDQFEGRLQRFADRFHASLSRELEAE